MGLFSKKQQRRSVLSGTPQDLAEIGRSAYGGDSPFPPGFGSLGMSSAGNGILDQYALDAMQAAGCWDLDDRRVYEPLLDELTAAADAGGKWAYVGAMGVAWNVLSATRSSDARYRAIFDRALHVMRDDGVGWAALTGYMTRHWEATEGVDRWPKSLLESPVPSYGDGFPAQDLGDGESRKLAETNLWGFDRVVYGERRADGTITAVLEGRTEESGGKLVRWDWNFIGHPTTSEYPAFLRAVGDEIATMPPWAHEDLIPWIPCRARSRDEMRLEAAKL